MRIRAPDESDRPSPGPSNEDAESFEWAVVGASLAIGSAVVVVGAELAGVDEPVAATGLVGTAAGLAILLYGLCSPRSPVTTRIAVAGLLISVLALGLAPLGDPGVWIGVGSVKLPGGLWGVAYLAGLVTLLLGGVLLPALERSDGETSDEREVGERRGPPDEDTTGRATMAIARVPDGTWTWRLTTPDGEILATAPREYDSASEASLAASRVTEALDGADPRVVNSNPPDDSDVPSGPGEVEDGPANSGLGSTPTPDRGSSDPVEDDGSSPNCGEAADEAVGTDGMEGFVGDDGKSAVFEVVDDDGEWTWRLRYDGRTVVAESTRGWPSLVAAERAVEEVQKTASDAGALTYDPGAFEVYRESSAGGWRWRLRDGDDVAAVGLSDYDTRADAMTVVRGVKEATREDASVRPSGDGDGYRWYVAIEGETIARSFPEFETSEEARSGLERTRERIDGAGVLELDPAGFAIRKRDDWGWELRHADERILATSPDHRSRERAIEGLRTLKRVAPHAEVNVSDRDTAQIIDEALSDAARARSMAERVSTDVGGDADEQDHGESTDATEPESADCERSDVGEVETGPGVEVVENDGWTWRLHDADRTLVAVDGFLTKRAAVEDVRRVLDALGRGSVLRVDPAAVEIPTDEAYRWRLVAADGAVLAASPAGFESVTEARAAVGTFGGAVSAGREPEIYREDGWRWRLRCDGEVVARSPQGFETTAAARDAFDSLDPYVSAAQVVECDAAVEVHTDEDGWTWRLRTPAGRVWIRGEGRFADPETAGRAAESTVEAADSWDRTIETPGSTDGTDQE